MNDQTEWEATEREEVTTRMRMRLCMGVTTEHVTSDRVQSNHFLRKCLLICLWTRVCERWTAANMTNMRAALRASLTSTAMRMRMGVWMGVW